MSFDSFTPHFLSMFANEVAHGPHALFPFSALRAHLWIWQTCDHGCLLWERKGLRNVLPSASPSVSRLPDKPPGAPACRWTVRPTNNTPILFESCGDRTILSITSSLYARLLKMTLMTERGQERTCPVHQDKENRGLHCPGFVSSHLGNSLMPFVVSQFP